MHLYMLLCGSFNQSWKDDGELKKGKSPFLAIQLLSQFGFDIKLQNRIFLTIQLLKPFTIGHRAVLMGGFNFFIYNLVLKTWNDHYFLLVAPI
jgi:hypothetical protein